MVDHWGSGKFLFNASRLDTVPPAISGYVVLTQDPTGSAPDHMVPTIRDYCVRANLHQVPQDSAQVAAVLRLLVRVWASHTSPDVPDQCPVPELYPLGYSWRYFMKWVRDNVDFLDGSPDCIHFFRPRWAHLTVQPNKYAQREFAHTRLNFL